MPPSDVISNSSSESDEENWDDVEQDGEDESLGVVSLLDDQVFSDALSMLSYCKEKFGFDFLAVRNHLGLDFYGSIKLINYIRHKVHEGQALPGEITPGEIEDDKYLKPVLDNDALIMSLDDLPEASTEVQDKGKVPEASSEVPPTEEDLRRKNVELQSELENLSKQFANYRLAVQETLDKRWGVDEKEQSDGSKGPSSKAPEEEKKDEHQYYWESYGYFDIHETMLKDSVRTDAYRDFIYGNKHLFAGKVVLDIGCGTGILSMFCAKAGASQVIAVDKSSIIDKARENVFNNGLDKQITCLRGRIEDVVLPVDKVDIIVSEWMGYCLLYEAMLPSVLFARDRYLKPDGLLVPSHSTICIAPVSDSEYVAENVTFWRDVYGFDMKAMQEGIYKDVRVLTMPEKFICGTTHSFTYDLHYTKVEDLVFKRPWGSTLKSNFETLDGFLIWFDIYFASKRDEKLESAVRDGTESIKRDGEIVFTTGPHGKETHWRQSLLLNGDSSSPENLKEGTKLSGELSYSAPEDSSRGLSIQLSWGASGSQKRTQTWLMK